LATIDAIGRCVVWLDEIEKGLAGATGGAADGGVSQDQLGAILSWMQDRKGQSFVIATANDVQGLPPELLRKGRFDELFFVDLPTALERGDIIAANLYATPHAKAPIDIRTVAAATAGFTGAELAAIIPDALFTAFADGARPPTTDDVIKAAASVTPLSKTAAEKISALRKWADARARRASLPEASDTSTGRQLDI
jgi:SpoVK/Ycf46/Vps4 family AAA+-type ATPase